MRYVYPSSPFFIYISRMFLLSGEGKHKSVFKKKTKLFLNLVVCIVKLLARRSGVRGQLPVSITNRRDFVRFARIFVTI